MESEINPRLRWQCRRGMLELDVLLGNFLEEAYLTLSTEDKSLFVKFLDSEDQDLFEWLMGIKSTNDPEKQLIARKILDHARNRHSPNAI